MPDIPAVSRRTLMGGALATGVAAGLGTGTASAAPSSPTGPTAPTGEHAPPRSRGQKSMADVPFKAHRTVRVGLIGLGNRGHGMASGWAAVPGCTVTA
ncbi:gfo/Idh/MocA family oxidoreductase, partial [Streptomyces pharetrae]